MKLKMGLKKIKSVFHNLHIKFKNLYDNTLEFINLKQEIRILTKELEESRNKEKPYIDKITILTSEKRVLKILNTKLEKKVKALQETIEELKKK